MNELKKQYVLQDISSTGKEIPWRGKQLEKVPLAEAYSRLGMESKACRCMDCGTFLSFKKFVKTNDPSVLIAANFCKLRLCPMCAYRRGLKIYGQCSKIMDRILHGIEAKENYRLLFLTLTIKNCDSDKLSQTLDKLFYGYKKLMLKIKVKKSIKGWFRALEVTHNVNFASLSFDTYHPHFHVILLVEDSYFHRHSNDYITQKEWRLMWRDVMNLDYNPEVNIKVFESEKKEHVKKSVAEVAKYTVKSAEFLCDDKELTDRAVFTLDKALARRRLVAYGGILKKIHKELNFDDPIDGKLEDTDNLDIELREDIDYVIENYQWNVGYKQYLRM